MKQPELLGWAGDGPKLFLLSDEILEVDVNHPTVGHLDVF
jgi:hypothetical protein